MLKPLFDKNCKLIAWIEPNEHIFDTNMNWIAYISNGHAWSTKTNTWMGPVKDMTCLDTNGKVFAWNPDCEIEGSIKPMRPMKPMKPMRPMRPMRPMKPMRPMRPLGGWSSIHFEEWIK